MVALLNPVVGKAAENNEALFIRLYESAFIHVARFVGKHNGTLQEAKDIFQDALVIFYEKHLAGNVHVTVSEEAYLLGIAKHLWIRKFNRDKSTVSLDATEQAITIPDDFYEAVEENKLMLFLEHAGRKCLDLLKAVYYDKAPMRRIKTSFGFGSEHSATVQKYKCLEKVRDMVKSKSLSYEDFLE